MLLLGVAELDDTTLLEGDTELDALLEPGIELDDTPLLEGDTELDENALEVGVKELDGNSVLEGDTESELDAAILLLSVAELGDTSVLLSTVDDAALLESEAKLDVTALLLEGESLGADPDTEIILLDPPVAVLDPPDTGLLVSPELSPLVEIVELLVTDPTDTELLKSPLVTVLVPVDPLVTEELDLVVLVTNPELELLLLVVVETELLDPLVSDPELVVDTDPLVEVTDAELDPLVPELLIADEELVVLDSGALVTELILDPLVLAAELIETDPLIGGKIGAELVSEVI